MSKLHLATGLSLPIEAVTEAIGFLGRRGSGKSYAAQKLAEELYRAKAQFIALDPVGNWWGLRLAADGKSPGIPIPVFGGLQGDIPIEPTAGKLIADTIVDRGISAVIDVSQFESDADKARFARAFCERFYFRKKSAPSAVHVFLEEAQEFIPQNPTRDEPQMLHAFTRLAKLGRNFGIGLSMLSQRPQEVNKKVINLAELLFVFQLTGVHERAAVDAWISDKGVEDEDIEAELPKLQRGKPHAWSPAWLEISRVVEIGPKWTYDASSTPKVGAGAVAARELSPIDLEKLRTDMAATIEKAKADDPKELKREIATLKAQLAKAGPQNSEKRVPSQRDQDRIDMAVVKDRESQRREFLRTIHGVRRSFDAIDRQIAAAVTSSSDAVKRLMELEASYATAPATNGHALVSEKRSIVPQNRTNVAPRAPKVANNRPIVAHEGLSKGQQKILNAMAELHALGVDAPTRTQLGLFAGYNLTGGTGAQHIADLNEKFGLVEIPTKGTVRLTDAGHAAADATGIPETLAELHERVLTKVSSGQRRIAEHLISIYPEPISRADLGAAVGYNLTGGTGAQHVADLVNLGAVTKPRDGRVVASDLLFPEGLA